ncbi:MAG TPA: sulfatase-like hydrolase/transferase [Verrucomicrobiae bacterium]|nr:sulfatase-like hydrolase/transferase [Verrucomicrobiae bacterium]
MKPVTVRVTLAVAMGATFSAAAATEEVTDTPCAQRPHLLLITADQLRFDALRCNGSRVARTPNLDRLAARGVSFRYAYTASPLCMPARASWLTGRWPHQHGICGNERPPLRPDQRAQCFPNRLRDAGYRSALVGKHHFFDHFGWQNFDYKTLQPDLKQFGFDAVTQVLDLGESEHNDDDYTAWLAARGALKTYREGVRNIRKTQPELPMKAEDTPDGWIANRALEILGDHDPKQPLFLWVSFVGPHPPYVAPPEHLARFKDMELGPRETAYHAMISGIDDYVGQIMESLQRRDMLDQTLVIFTADHGDMLGDHGIWDKRWFYEASAKVPLIVAGPGFGKQPNRQTADKGGKELVTSLDVPMTLLEAAGTRPPDDPVPWSGRPLQRVVRHEPGALREAVFSELGTGVMMRTAQWKMWFDPEQGGAVALFHLRGDPEEKTNLADSPDYADVRARLTTALLSWMRRTTSYTELKEYHRLQEIVVGPPD